ncbi:uncharacterized protein LOC103363077 [Stegastes partitus]|uniref:Uncharacterized LOC103363077 n=1 Tax=Stegastes partitus TaxID=144197 RepID=A0A3B5BGD0_9TELE|nr:PREDICTED: uncharacterized protein LOC103363077 [Stegastes partitus]
MSALCGRKMAETRRNYQSVLSEPPNMQNGLGKKFFVIVEGITHDAHQHIVERFKRGEGQTEVTSHDQCDYLLVFCPVSSRVGTNITEALNHLPADKPAILVVMHHTFNPDNVVAESRRLVNNPNILLTVDCLFHDNQLLNCHRNDQMWYEVYNLLRASQPSAYQPYRRMMNIYPKLICLLLIVLVIVTVIIFLVVRLRKASPKQAQQNHTEEGQLPSLYT